MYTDFPIYWIAAPNDIEMMVCAAIVAFTSFIFDKLCTCSRLSTHQINTCRLRPYVNRTKWMANASTYMPPHGSVKHVFKSVYMYERDRN